MTSRSSMPANNPHVDRTAESERNTILACSTPDALLSHLDSKVSYRYPEDFPWTQAVRFALSHAPAMSMPGAVHVLVFATEYRSGALAAAASHPALDAQARNYVINAGLEALISGTPVGGTSLEDAAEALARFAARGELALTSTERELLFHGGRADAVLANHAETSRAMLVRIAQRSAINDAVTAAIVAHPNADLELIRAIVRFHWMMTNTFAAILAHPVYGADPQIADWLAKCTVSVEECTKACQVAHAVMVPRWLERLVAEFPKEGLATLVASGGFQGRTDLAPDIIVPLLASPQVADRLLIQTELLQTIGAREMPAPSAVDPSPVERTPRPAHRGPLTTPAPAARQASR